MVQFSQVEVRSFQASEIEHYCDYFFRSPPGYLEGIGLVPTALGSESEMRASLETRTSQWAKGEGAPTIATVLYLGRVVGVHTLTQLKPFESAIMHAHFFRAEDRGLGIGPISYFKAMEWFLKMHSLKEIIFKTPVANRGALRIKEKLGISSTGETFYESPIVIGGKLPARLYRVSSADLAEIRSRLSD